jgi:hypothetical protein
VSRWSSPDAAANFATIYAGSLKRRYHSMRLVNAASKNPDPTSAKKREWLTEDGDVVIEAQGDIVLITESFDEVTSQRLRDAVFSKANAAAVGN